MTLSPLVIALVLAAAVMHATWNAVVKAGGDRLARAALAMATPSVLALIALPFLPPLDWAAAWPWLVTSIIVHCLYYTGLLNAYRYGDLSQVYPIARGSAPALAALGAWIFIGESLTWLEALALALLSAGLVALAYRPAHKRGEHEGRAVLFALATGLTIAVYSISDGLGARSTPSPFSYIAWLFALEALPLLFFTLWRRRGRLRESFKGAWGPGIGGGVIAGAAYGIVMWAMTVAPIAHVVALRETSVLFAALIGTRILSEPFGRQRIAAALVIVTGAVALQLAKS